MDVGDDVVSVDSANVSERPHPVWDSVAVGGSGGLGETAPRAQPSPATDAHCTHPSARALCKHPRHSPQAPRSPRSQGAGWGGVGWGRQGACVFVPGPVLFWVQRLRKPESSARGTPASSLVACCAPAVPPLPSMWCALALALAPRPRPAPAPTARGCSWLRARQRPPSPRAPAAAPPQHRQLGLPSVHLGTQRAQPELHPEHVGAAWLPPVVTPRTPTGPSAGQAVMRTRAHAQQLPRTSLCGCVLRRLAWAPRWGILGPPPARLAASAVHDGHHRLPAFPTLVPRGTHTGWPLVCCGPQWRDGRHRASRAFPPPARDGP